MALAADKLSKATRVISANALVGARVMPSGFSNVLMEDAFNFSSGNRCDRLVFFGETAPGTNYDDYAVLGDEYWQVVFTSGTPTTFTKFVLTTNGWEKYLTQNDADWSDILTASAIVTAGAGTYTAAQLEGGVILRDPTGASRTDTLSTAALLVAAIQACAVGSSVRCQVKNTADANEIITIGAGTGNTLVPTDIYIYPGQTKELLLVCTNATVGTEAFSVYDFDTISDDLVKTITTDVTAGANTWTAAELLNGILLRDPTGGARSDVTPTAALLVAAVPGARVGQTFEFTMINNADADELITVTGGVGCTLAPTLITLGRNQAKKFIALLTNVTAASEAYTVYEIGLGHSDITARKFSQKRLALADLGGGAQTALVAVLFGGYSTNDCGGAGVNVTTDTATNIVAAIPNCQIGSSFEWTLENISNGAEAITLVAGADITLQANQIITVARTYAKTFIFLVTDVAAPKVTVMVKSEVVANAI